MSNKDLFWGVLIIGIVLAILILLPYFVAFIKTLIKKTRYNQMGSSSQARLVRQLEEAIKYLSKNKIGAILTILQKDKLNSFRTDGIKIDADISASLIIAIFQKKSPIHDGAIIIDRNKIEYAGTYYKITSRSIDNRYGARHRAAMGISEQTDSLTIVVSEETGEINFTYNSQFHKIPLSDFQEKLIEFLK